jgi:hypothetical protein
MAWTWYRGSCRKSVLPTPSTSSGSNTETVHVLLSAMARPAKASTRPSQHAPPLPHLQSQPHKAHITLLSLNLHSAPTLNTHRLKLTPLHTARFPRFRL